jgi:hypothetical protein
MQAAVGAEDITVAAAVVQEQVEVQSEDTDKMETQAVQLDQLQTLVLVAVVAVELGLAQEAELMELSEQTV